MQLLGRTLPPLPQTAQQLLTSFERPDFSELSEKLVALEGQLPQPVTDVVQRGQDLLATEESRNVALAVGIPILTLFLLVSVASLLSSKPVKNSSDTVKSLERERAAIAEGLPTTFEPEAVTRYFQKRILFVAFRQFQLFLIAGGVAARIIYDYNVRSKEGAAEQAPKRAQELVEALTQLGPAFVKIGQALSIRPDFLPEPYPQYLAKLQDGVEPFDSAVAVAILEEELGARVEDVFGPRRDFDKPIASASLGQVYKTTYRTPSGEEVDVAVKVQRPGLLETCTRDLIVSRSILGLIAKIAGPESRVGRNCLSTIQVIDVYGARFIDELDYNREARSTSRLSDDLQSVEDLADVVKVPEVFRSTRHTLVTQWIDGVKITSVDVSDPAEKERVQTYISVLLNVYLAQLLDTGFLHSDPHPGNFLLLNDGRIGILDCGLMTEITREQQNAMIKYVSHLSSKQFGKTLEDLIALGFLDKELSENEENRKIVAPIIAEVLSQVSKGGGTAAFDRMDRTSLDGVGLGASGCSRAALGCAEA
mmetsp:Transcript_4781/g.19157  ORF Transcript_4781/g.19157 Transcript_4781/m.19157 type:complete len:536 (-) Transcript_4781:802-2409(-)